MTGGFLLPWGCLAPIFMSALLSLQVSALGHSAGAHMWAMVLLERARAARKERPAKDPQTAAEGAAGPARLPACLPGSLVGASLPLVGMAALMSSSAASITGSP